MMNKLTLLIFFLLNSIGIAFAQWSSDPSVNTVVKDDPKNQEVTPLQATTSTGATYVSWFESQSGSYVLKMQLFDKAGNKLWDPAGLLISDMPQNSALYVYDLKTDNNGNAIVAFQDERTGDLVPVAYKVDQKGNELWGPNGIIFNDASATFQVAPAIGIFTDNSVAIAWNASDNSGKKWIPYEVLDANGNNISGMKHIKNNSVNFSRPKFISPINTDPRLIFIKEKGKFPAITSLIYARALDESGNSIWANDALISNKSISFVAYPSLAVNNRGGIYFAFNSSDPQDLFLNDAFAQSLDVNGNILWAKNGIEVSILPNYNRESVGIAWDSVQESISVLLQVLDANQFVSGMYVQLFDNNGNRLLGKNGERLIKPGSFNYVLPYSINTTSDGFIAIYTVGGVTSQELFAKKLDFNATEEWTTTLSSVNSNKYNVRTGDFEKNQLVVVWYDERNDGGIYAQNIQNDGTLGNNSRMESSMLTSFSVYPTIASNELTVVNPDYSEAYFSLYNLSGQLVQQQILNGGSNQITLSQLPAGIYEYVIRIAEQNKQSGKIVIQK